MFTDISDQVRHFIVGRYPNATVRDDEDIFSLGFVNSLFAMELVMFLEKTFDLAIPNAELRMDNFRTVEAMTDLVRRQGAGATAGSR